MKRNKNSEAKNWCNAQLQSLSSETRRDYPSLSPPLPGVIVLQYKKTKFERNLIRTCDAVMLFSLNANK